MTTMRSEQTAALTPVQRTELLGVLAAAEERASRLERAIVASYTVTLTDGDPLALYASVSALQTAQAWYWERPSSGFAFAAAGAAAEWSAERSGVAAAKAAWHALVADAVVAQGADIPERLRGAQPVCLGGFAFDPLAPKSKRWSGFPAASLALPAVMVTRSGAGCTLTLNALMRPGDYPQTCAGALVLRAERLLTPRVAMYEQPRADTSLALHEPLPPGVWKRLVADTTSILAGGDMRKVVLARAVEAASAGPLDVIGSLWRLRACYPTATVFAVRRGARTFLGATPERLASVDRGHLETMALAGTVARGVTAPEDARLADEVLRGAKNQEEQSVVVSFMRDALTPICQFVALDPFPHIRMLPNLQHLETGISGELLPGKSLFDVVEVLHPTPATAGFPRDAALQYIRECEGLDRGWYAGTIGWVDAGGDGEFVVALRSALVEGSTATLYAGCGIVADSDPEAEYAESWLKLRVMLDALGNAGDEE